MGDEREAEQFDTFRPELDADETIRNIYYTLTGRYWDEDQQKIVKNEEIIQHFSDNVINELMKTIRFYINPISQTTKLKDLDIRLMCFEIYCKVVELLSSEDKTDFKIVFKTAEEIKSLIFMAQMSSQGGFKYDRYTKTVSRDENVNITEDRTSKGTKWGKSKSTEDK